MEMKKMEEKYTVLSNTELVEIDGGFGPLFWTAVGALVLLSSCSKK